MVGGARLLRLRHFGMARNVGGHDVDLLQGSGMTILEEVKRWSRLAPALSHGLAEKSGSGMTIDGTCSWSDPFVPLILNN